MMDLSIIIGCIIGVLFLVLSYLIYEYNAKKWQATLKESNNKYDRAVSHRKSAEVRLGKIGENLAPFIKDWPYNPDNFRFLGYPIDGIQLDDDAVILIEIKTGNARLSKSQKRVKQLVKEGKVYFETFRISENGCELKREED